MKPVATKPLRCAIYTRVSSGDGLEQEFNSLDNQREAAEAYIKSQAHEGWRCLPAAYDDGGFSGGSVDRPALQRLLTDIRARRVDVVVVYKVDRLTRSLADFAKLVELFDAQEVSFVSVTQAFNTTSSMGRLTLNVLLSFAQFEREVTSERIRDKIAASKRKGMRMGGPTPLGYNRENKKLVENPIEADNVRLIFRRYLDLGCLAKLSRDLEERVIVTKVSRLASGATRGGIPFTRGPLHYLLRNRVYIGENVHKGQYFPGEHEPIVGRELFDAVEERLRMQAREYRHTRINNASLLKGRIFDDRGNRMTPCSAKKNGARYRYYVSKAVLQCHKEHAGSVSRVPAPEVETLVLETIRKHCASWITRSERKQEGTDSEVIAQTLQSVTIKPGIVEIAVTEAEDSNPIEIAWTRPPTRKRRLIVSPVSPGTMTQPIRSENRARLLEGIAKARMWLEQLVDGSVQSTAKIADREGCSERSVRMTLNLAFVSPLLAAAAVEGTLAFGMGTTHASNLAACWSAQTGGA